MSGAFGVPSSGVLCRRRNGRHEIDTAVPGRSATIELSAASRLRFPTQHHGHLRSEMTSIWSLDVPVGVLVGAASEGGEGGYAV